LWHSKCPQFTRSVDRLAGRSHASAPPQLPALLTAGQVRNGQIHEDPRRLHPDRVSGSKSLWNGVGPKYAPIISERLSTARRARTSRRAVASWSFSSSFLG